MKVNFDGQRIDAVAQSRWEGIARGLVESGSPDRDEYRLNRVADKRNRIEVVRGEEGNVKKAVAKGEDLVEFGLYCFREADFWDNQVSIEEEVRLEEVI